jgi:hypothetical protein
LAEEPVTATIPNKRRAIGGHHSARMITDTWLTPRWILDPLGRFDLDPCAAPDPRLWPTAARHITRPDNGLTQPWAGRVWLNPPYSREAVRWLARLADHGHGTGLIFARTETTWFQRQVWQRATGLLFLAGRVRFLLADGSEYHDNAGAPSVLVAYGRTDADVLAGSGLPGVYVSAWTRPSPRNARTSPRM